MNIILDSNNEMTRLQCNVNISPQNILLNIASAFLSFADHFKLYSSFCASHSKAQKLLHPTEGNHALQQFLAARNPRQQHSNTLESYLIKPIQRILKYPLLLQQLRNLCDTNTEEYRNLVGEGRDLYIFRLDI